MIMQNIRHSIEISASKEKVWEVLWSDQTLRDWANIIDEGTYMEGQLQEGHEVNFMSGNSGYGVNSRVEKLIPNEFVSFKQVADIKIDKDGSIEKRDKQWTGGLDSYELTENHGKTELSNIQDVPDELVEMFKTRIPQALQRIKVLAEKK
jgi:uncharacterized protein YndB with AHSA1/START domain